MNIYKYRSLDKSTPLPKNGIQSKSPFDYTIELLRTSNVWHSDSKNLNDVFELNPRIEDGVNLHDLREILTSNLENGTLQQSDYDGIIHDIEGLKNHIIDKGFIKQTLSELVAKIELETGICSFSTSSKKPILWGNYADCGKGICIEFEIPDELINILFFPVQYSKDRAVLSGADLLLRQNEMFNVILATKSIDWCAEDEIRSLSKKVNVAFPVAGNIKSILLGPKISKEDIDSIAQLNLNVPIYKTFASESDFEVLVSFQ